MAQLSPRLRIDPDLHGVEGTDSVKTLVLQAPWMPDLEIDFAQIRSGEPKDGLDVTSQASLCNPGAQLCGKRHSVSYVPDASGTIARWLHNFFTSSPCDSDAAHRDSESTFHLVEMATAADRDNFANDGAYLLISQSDVDSLNERLIELHQRDIGSDNAARSRHASKRAAAAHVTTASFRFDSIHCLMLSSAFQFPRQTASRVTVPA